MNPGDLFAIAVNPDGYRFNVVSVELRGQKNFFASGSQQTLPHTSQIITAKLTGSINSNRLKAYGHYKIICKGQELKCQLQSIDGDTYIFHADLLKT